MKRNHDDGAHALAPEVLHDYVDGALDAARRERVEEHLAACPRCRRDVERLRELLLAAATLPPEVEPPRDLWPQIRARLAGAYSESGAAAPGATDARGARADRAEPRRLGRPRQLWTWSGWAAAAAAVLYILLARGPDPARTPLPAEEPAAPAAVALAAARGLEGGSMQAQDEYVVALRAHGDRLPPEVIALIDSNLRLVDGAISATRAALAEDPDNVQLARRLAESYRGRIHLLRQAIRSTVLA